MELGNLKRTLTTIAAIMLVGALAPPAGAAEWTVPPSDRATVTSAATPQVVVKAGVGVFKTVAEDVREKPSGTLRAKGCWSLVKKNKSAKAKVKVWIERQTKKGKWTRVSGSKTSTLRSGCTDKTIFTRGCDPTSKKYLYRSRVDVDVIGEADTPEVATGRHRWIACFA